MFIFLLVMHFSLRGHDAFGIINTYTDRQDCEKAIKFLIQNNDTMGIDPSKLGCIQVVRQDKDPKAVKEI